MINAFFNSIRNGNIKRIERILDEDYTVIDMQDKLGRTPLMEAIIFKKEDITRILIKNTANINIQDHNGWGALHFAAQEFLINTTDLLLKNKAKVDLQDNNGNTPLFRALFSAQGKSDIIVLLLKAGANKDLKNDDGVSPFDLAKQITNFDLLQFFQ